jgi:Mn-dependent DtxR family transcriptional regulator
MLFRSPEAVSLPPPPVTGRCDGIDAALTGPDRPFPLPNHFFSFLPTVSTAATRESVAVEDYLEKIHELIDEKGYARVADIADSFGIARPSVSNMVRRLDEKGLVKHVKYRGMTLTAEGERLARRIIKRHGILSEFLDLLGIDAATAYRDVEGMEHHISTETLRGIEQIITELRRNANLQARVRAAATGEGA